MAKGTKIATNGGDGLGQNPFAGLSATGLPSFAKASEGTARAAGSERVAKGSEGVTRAAGAEGAARASDEKKNRGRVDVLRSTAGRGGKTVTVVQGFVGIGLPEKEELAKKIQRAAGVGGTVKEGRIEIQGDKREVAARVLSEAGFRPVMAGG